MISDTMSILCSIEVTTVSCMVYVWYWNDPFILLQNHKADWKMQSEKPFSLEADIPQLASHILADNLQGTYQVPSLPMLAGTMDLYYVSLIAFNLQP